MKLNKITASALAIGAVGLAGLTTSASAQSYSAPGNDPVRGHSHLGDRPIDCHGGGSVVYRDAYVRLRSAPVQKYCRRVYGALQGHGYL